MNDLSIFIQWTKADRFTHSMDPGLDYLLCVIPCIAVIRSFSSAPIYVIDYTDHSLSWSKYQNLDFEVIKVGKNSGAFKELGYFPILLRPFEMERFAKLSSAERVLFVDLDQIFVKSPEDIHFTDKLHLGHVNGGMVYFRKGAKRANSALRILQDFTREVLSDASLRKQVVEHYDNQGFLLDEAITMWLLDHDLRDLKDNWEDIPNSVCMNDLEKDSDGCCSIHLHSKSLKPFNSIRVRGLAFFFMEESYRRMRSMLGDQLLYHIFPKEWESYQKFSQAEIADCLKFISRFTSKYQFGRSIPLML